MKTIEITINRRNYKASLFPGIVFVIVLFVVFSFFAVSNLLNQVAIVPSILWFVFASFWCVFVIWDSWHYVSIKYLLIHMFSFYAKREFAVIELREAVLPVVRFGYDFYWFQTFGMSIPIEKIKEISWSPGQATSVTGEDMNDWKVCIKFDNNPPLISKEYDFHLMPTNENKYLTKDEAQKLGLDFVGFLNKAGARVNVVEDGQRIIL
jgi:hypothetical protein